MTFSITNFTSMGSNSTRGLAPARFSYRTTDGVATIDGAGYFNDVYYQLEVGDIIDVTVVDDVTTPTSVTAFGQFIVASNASGVVDTYNVINTATPTDSD